MDRNDSLCHILQKSSRLLEPGGERCYPDNDRSVQGLASELSRTFFTFAVCWGRKVRRCSCKKLKMKSWDNFRHKFDSIYRQHIRRIRWEDLWLLYTSTTKTASHETISGHFSQKVRMFQKSFEPSHFRSTHKRGEKFRNRKMLLPRSKSSTVETLKAANDPGCEIPWVEVFFSYLVCAMCRGVLDDHRRIGWSFTCTRRKTRNNTSSTRLFSP